MFDQTDGVIRLSVSLYPEQHALVTRLARETGLENVSAVLRLIISEWAQMKGVSPSAQPAASEPQPA